VEVNEKAKNVEVGGFVLGILAQAGDALSFAEGGLEERRDLDPCYEFRLLRFRFQFLAVETSSCSRLPRRRSLFWRINSRTYSLGVRQSTSDRFYSSVKIPTLAAKNAARMGHPVVRRWLRVYVLLTLPGAQWV